MFNGNYYTKTCLTLIFLTIILLAQGISTVSIQSDDKSARLSSISPPTVDVEYVLHITPNKGGWILVKFRVYNEQKIIFFIGEYMKDVIEITESNVPYSYNRGRGILSLNTAGRSWAWFNYTFPRLVWYYSLGKDGYLPKRILIVDVGDYYVQLYPKMAFFLPANFKPKYVAIRLDGILEGWFVVAAYSQRIGNMLFFDDYNLFIHSPFLAGKLYKLAESMAGDTMVYFPLFASKLLLNDTINLATYDGAYDIYLSALHKTNIIAHGVQVMSKLLELPTPYHVYMYPHRKTLPEGAQQVHKYITDMRLYDALGVFHNDMIWRVGHILHHYASIWLNGIYNLEFENVTEPIWFKGMQDYLGYVTASIVTNSSIYNGSLIVPRYLIYLRSFEERRTAMGTHWGGPVYVRYVYAPLAMFYLDNILRNKSRGLLNIYKLHGLAVADRKWQLVSDQEVETILENEFGINMSKYFNEVKYFKLNKTLLKKFVERGKWYDYFYSYLDFIRENFTLAPDTIFMIYLEYVAWKGDPEFALYPFNQQLYQSVILNYLLQNLNQTDSLTRDKLIKIINNLTDGKSTDFFRFYTTYARLNLSVAEVKAFINGTYPRILSELIAAKKMINALSRAINVSDLSSEFQKAYLLLKKGDYSGAESFTNNLLEKIYEIKYKDSDHDLVPDWVEVLYGTNPYLPDTDRDGINDLYDIFLGRIVVDGDISDWLANSAYILNVTRNNYNDRSPISGNAIKSVYVAHDDKYLYIAIRFFDKPYTVQNRLVLAFDRDLDMRTSNDRVCLPMSIPRTVGMETLNLGYFGDFVEIKLPLETLQLLGIGRKFILIPWIDTWGDIGLPYYVPSLPRKYLDSLSIEVNLNSLPPLPTDRCIGVPVTETTTITTTMTKTLTTSTASTITISIINTTTTTTTAITTVTTAITVVETKTKTLTTSITKNLTIFKTSVITKTNTNIRYWTNVVSLIIVLMVVAILATVMVLARHRRHCA